jgi:hypothetical protein
MAFDDPGSPATLHLVTRMLGLGWALLFRARGDLAAARPLFERALAINEKVFGPDHP